MSIDLHKRLLLLVNGEEKSLPIFPYHGCALPTELGGQASAFALAVSLLLSLPPV